MNNVIVQVSDDYQMTVCTELSCYDNTRIVGVSDYRKNPKIKSIDHYAFYWTANDIISFHENDYSFNEGNVKCSSDFWIKIRKYEQFFLSMTDRLSHYPVSTTKLRRVYYSFVLRWVKAYRDSRANTVIFFETPHMGFDFVSYIVAEILDLDIRIINRTGISYSSRLVNKLDLWNDKSNSELTPDDWNIDYFKTDIISTDVTIFISEKINKQVIDGYINIIHAHKIFLRTLVTGMLQLFKKKQNILSSVFWISGPRSRLKMLLEDITNYRRTRALYKEYCNECVSDLPSPPFVFFPSHYQPERSTTPEGGCFDENLLILNSLLKCLPDDVKVIYKEHPRQFDAYDLRRKFSRDPSYYKHINSYDNVFLVEPSWDAKEIMEKSIAVVTVTGTSGWDALKIGKPCITFGDAWYRNCTACLHVSDLTTKTVSELLKLDKESVEKRATDFINYTKMNFVHAANCEYILVHSNEELNSLEHAQRMARALFDTFCNKK